MQNNSNSSGWILYESVSSGDHLRQGDLIEFSENIAPRQFGLVVTADCDLENIKYGRLITLVPVVSVKTITEHYLLLEYLDRYQRQSLVSYVKKLNMGDVNDPIVAADLRIQLKDGSLGQDHLGYVAVKVLLNELDMINGSDFCSLMTAIGISTAKLPDKIEAQIKDKGDLVKLPKPEFLSEKLVVAWVRPVWQVPVREIVLQNSKSGGALGVRVARLDSPFRYRVTQVMGQVFSDIGTPNVSHDFLASLKEVFSL